MISETKYCHHCGAEIDIEAVACPSCGILQHNKTINKKPKNPDFAALLTFLVMGVGQMYTKDEAVWPRLPGDR